MRAAVARSRIAPRGDVALVAGLAAAVGAALIVAAALGLPGAYPASLADVAYRDVAVLHKVIDARTVDRFALALDPARAAFLDMAAARQAGLRTAMGRSRLASAEIKLAAGLQSEPADAYGWTRRATVLVQIRGPSPEAAKALSTALLIAPRDRKLAPIQFDLAVMLWPQMDAAGREALARRFRFIAGAPDLQSQARAFQSTELGRTLSPRR